MIRGIGYAVGVAPRTASVHERRGAPAMGMDAA
jgi:hypothetical protein